MFFRSRGIVLHSTKYSDTSLIVKIYTEELGLQSYMIRAARKSRSKMKSALFQPLTLLDLVVSYNKKQKIQFIKEITASFPFTGIPYDIRKSAIAIFIAEILCKTIREEEQNKPLFEFLFNNIQFLDKKDGRISEFNIYFLIDLTKFLGFELHDNFDENSTVFNLYDGKFQEYISEHPYFVEKELSKKLHEVINIPIDKRYENKISAGVRKNLLNKMLDYYRIHVNGFNILNSQAVMTEVFE